ncbi:MAG: HNH endonuclease [Comamonadaceae bacterium]|nr:MAG: HNH endonuclease [Comamonadaceae bacterium]
MRPVDKGAAPAVYAKYQDAGPDLQSRLGDYCSYCERQIETHLAVEHVQPKVRRAYLATAWQNFLLGCVHCNSSKGKKRVVLSRFYWPDRDNTLRAFEYIAGGRVQPSAALAAAEANRAQETIALTGLDKYPGNPGREPTASDRRWLRRLEIWRMAHMDRDRLAVHDSVAMREVIVENALGRGMFTIWWTVFAGDIDMRRRLRQAFLGTHHASFDANEDPIIRVGGQL